ncbi:MAG: glutamate-5-semialdehyde dehydrogenase [SAR324 cluster bacterium]|nr:glutamate-5-semialdehyde dehydrogenase [SAR324 cluster bacterium]
MTDDLLVEQTKAARGASIQLANLQTEQKNKVLYTVANHLRQSVKKILQANQKDQEAAQMMVDQGKLSSSAYKRLLLNEEKIEQMALNMESVAQLPDPVGKVKQAIRLDQGLDLYQVTCPIGVLLIIFESRPEVVVQISALAIKSGNAVILKGGSEAQYSNQVLTEVIREALESFDFMPEEAINLLNTRDEVSQVLQMSEYIDLIIPRGSNALVQHIQAHSKAPVLAHADGICHVYLDESADPQKCEEIVLDAKLQYPAVCNAMETLLVHQNIPETLLAQILLKLQDAHVELKVCPITRERMKNSPSLQLKDAVEEDWSTEYTDLILSIKSVSSLEEAVAHINSYGSKHTDAIVTENQENAEWFMNQVDTASAFWNASTRFADGFRYGFGAEVGISTNKTHARGPVGLDGLVIYKFKLYGQGQGVGRYEGKKFLHETIDTA